MSPDPEPRPVAGDERRLVEAARAGEPEALGALYARYGRRLFHLAYRLLGSRADAEDVLHDVFVGLPEALGRYREQGRFEGWLVRVTVRTALMRMRAVRRRREVNEVDGAGCDDQARLNARRTIDAALDRLPPKLRTVVVLKALEGYTHVEIGHLLGIRPNTSEVRYCRALKRMRDLLGEA